MKKFIKASILFAVILAAAISLAACGNKTTVNDDGTKTKTEGGVKITETAAKAVQTEKYETADFSITIPRGWVVTSGGTNIYHSIRVGSRRPARSRGTSDGGQTAARRVSRAIHSQALRSSCRRI